MKKIPLWWIPWQAKKRILELEGMVKQDIALLNTKYLKNRSELRDTTEKLAKMTDEYDKLKAATAALGNWVCAAHRLTELPKTKEVKSIL